MWMVLVAVGVLLLAVVIFFWQPYSKTKSAFEKTVAGRVAAAPQPSGVFTEEDIRHLPAPVQRYFRYCGYLGKPKMSYMKASFSNVDFVMSPDRTIKIDYTQYNFVSRPERFAYIASSLFGIPFEGYDSFGEGVGSMQGTLAKVIPLFDQRGEKMDKACLVTMLAEAPLLPSALLQDYVTWEEIDDTHVKATIAYEGMTASGVFTFDQKGAITLFRTSDRVATDMAGNERAVDWSALFSDYEEVNGVMQPTILQSIWHYPEGDSVYFNQNRQRVTVEYGV